MGKLKLLEDKIQLLLTTIEYVRQLLQREIVRQKRGSSTNVDVETLRLELLSIERDIQNIYGEKYITILKILASDGNDIMDKLQN